MTQPPEHFDDLRELLSQLTDGELSDVERDRLRRMIADDPAARQFYFEYITLHAALCTEHPAEGAGFSAAGSGPLVYPTPSSSHTTATQPAGAAASMPAAMSIPVAGPRQGRLRMAVIRTTAIAAAVVLLASLAAVVISLISRPAALPAAPGRIAMISDISPDAAFDGNAPELGAQLSRGELSLRSGKAQLMFSTGAVVDLIGPCEFQTTGPNRGYLRSGRIAAYVPHSARGFTIETAGFDVVDLGTEFGLDVDQAAPTRGQVHVFVGQVDVRLKRSPRVLHLTAGHAMRIDAGASSGGATTAAVALDPAKFDRSSMIIAPSDAALHHIDRKAYAAMSDEQRKQWGRRDSALVLSMSFDHKVADDESGRPHVLHPMSDPPRSDDVPAPLASGHSIKLIGPTPPAAAPDHDAKTPAKTPTKSAGPTYVVVAPAADLTADNMTLSLWIKGRPDDQPHDRDDGYAHIISMLGNGGAGNVGWALTQSQMTDGVYVRNDTTALFNQCLAHVAGVLDGRWHHLAVVWHADALDVYLDGKPAAEQKLQRGAGLDGRHPLVIGAQNKDGHRSFVGLLDEVALYRVALSNADIARLAAGDPPISVPGDAAGAGSPADFSTVPDAPTETHP